MIWSAVEIVSGALGHAGKSEDAENCPGRAKQKTRQQGKLIVLARILVQACAAKKILETGIRTQAVQHQARF